jgi:hypothetical protein
MATPRETLAEALEALHQLQGRGVVAIRSRDLSRRAAAAGIPRAMQRIGRTATPLAARGYYDAFPCVKESLAKVLRGGNAGAVARDDHAGWYRQLFGPSVTARIISAVDLAGYRGGPVYIRRSRHVPPPREAVRDCMPALFDLLEGEAEPAVRVVLGHFVFVYIHPYMDGNGRMGRFLMNLMAASGGYPWTIVPVERRDDYMRALEAASVGQDIRPLAEFIGGLAASALRGAAPPPVPGGGGRER